MKHIHFILLFCLLGSIVRIVYGFHYTPWDQAPDQVVWEMVLNHGIQTQTFSYDHWIHYPHEGGSILISFFGYLFSLVSDFHVLTLVALFLDFVVRWVQLYIVGKLFSSWVFNVFGLWSILGLPLIINWGLVNFGLHYWSGLFPFLLIYLLSGVHQKASKSYLHGSILAFFTWFSYINFLLFPFYVAYAFIIRKSKKELIKTILSFIGALLLLFSIRYFGDAGFHLSPVSKTAVRATSFNFSNLEIYQQLYKIWGGVLSDATLATPQSSWLQIDLKFGWLVITFVGGLSLIYFSLKRKVKVEIWLSLLFCIVFILVYSISPFYYAYDRLGNFISYRHLAYILPFLSLLIVVGLEKIKGKTLFAAGYLLYSFYGLVLLFTQSTSVMSTEKIAGWILATKFGHHPELLSDIIEVSDYDSDQLYQGVGWGISAALFEDVKKGDSQILQIKVEQLEDICNRLPISQLKNIRAGIQFSFQDGITPALDRGILVKMNQSTISTD